MFRQRATQLLFTSFIITGPMPYILVPEIWAQAPRPAAMSISTQVNWLTNFMLSIVFIFMQVR